VKAANPFYRQNVAFKQQSPGRANWLVQALQIPVDQRERRATAFARDGLRVMTTIFWVAVLLFTFRAHGKVDHRGRLAVIRESLSHCESWTAIYARGGPVFFVPFTLPQIPQTVATDRDVWRREAKFALTAGRYRELGVVAWAAPFHAYIINARDGRALSEKLDELNYSGARSLDLNVYVRTEVLNVASQVQFCRVRINERPEAYSLHNALHAYLRSYPLARPWSHGDPIAAIRVAFYKRVPI
jgi:hypothetical protein